MILHLRFKIILVVLLVGANAYAQMEGTMPFMSSLPQVSYYNPAFKPAYRFSVGLPGSSIFAQYTNNGFTYNDFISKENGLLVADIGKLYNAMRDKNYINANIQVDLFRFSLKVNPRLYLTINATVKGYNRLMIPKDAVGLFANGTEPYINKTASLSPEGEAIEYLETGVGAAYSINRKLTIGGRLKFLKGIMNATTQSAAFNLTLANTYAITVSGGADVLTSGIHNLSQSGYDAGKNWSDYLNNTGFAVDLGGTYEVNDKISVGLSLIDLGSISWSNDVYGYKIDPAKSAYTFEGISAKDLLNGNSNYSTALSDSIQKKFKFEESKRGSYSVALPAKIYVTGSYKLSRSVRVNALFFAEQFKGRFMPGFSTSIGKEFGRRLSTSISYTISNNSFNSLGAGLSLNLPPFQIHLVSDNLIPLSFSALAKDVNSYVNSSNYLNIRTGINFVFGWDKAPEKQPYPTQNKSKK